MGNSWKDLFNFTRREQGGIGILLLILLLLLILKPLIPHLVSVKDQDVQQFQRQAKQFLKEMDSLKRINIYNPCENLAKQEDTPHSISLTDYLRNPFPFDPNKADKETLLKTGLSAFAVSNLLRYREKGGRIHSASAICKIYGTEEKWFDAVKKYIDIEEDVEISKHDSSEIHHQDIQAFNYETEKRMEEKTLSIELNKTDSTELILCSGIGPSFARRIISYREILGGFYDKSQLLEVYGMDSARYMGFQHQVTVNPELINRMHLDTISFKGLLKHPYFEFYLVKAIFNYKDRQKGIDSIQELKNLPEIYPELFKKLSPYLSIGDMKEK
jgi:DNA uptake protein ComE-like DNA-binding protein